MILSFISRSDINDQAVLLLRQFANAHACKRRGLKLDELLKVILSRSKPYKTSEIAWARFEWLFDYCIPESVYYSILEGDEQPLMKWTEPYMTKDIMNSTIGYHVNKISKGRYGEFSKITEEYQELSDAIDQKNKVMVGCELADLIGAIEGFAESQGLKLNDLIVMNNATKRAFNSGERRDV